MKPCPDCGNESVVWDPKGIFCHGCGRSLLTNSTAQKTDGLRITDEFLEKMVDSAKRLALDDCVNRMAEELLEARRLLRFLYEAERSVMTSSARRDLSEHLERFDGGEK